MSKEPTYFGEKVILYLKPNDLCRECHKTKAVFWVIRPNKTGACAQWPLCARCIRKHDWQREAKRKVSTQVLEDELMMRIAGRFLTGNISAKLPCGCSLTYYPDALGFSRHPCKLHISSDKQEESMRRLWVKLDSMTKRKSNWRNIKGK